MYNKIPILLLVISLIYPQVAIAKSEQWEVSPSTCVVDKSGEFCRLEILLSIPTSFSETIATSPLCFNLGEQQLTCLAQKQHSILLNVEFNESSELRVLSGNEMLFSQLIEIQALTPKTKRRRVKSPWSLF